MTAQKPYEEWQPQQCPPQLQRGGLGAFEATSGKLKDQIVDRLQEATTADFPDLAAADALLTIGEERGLPRVAGETDANYRERLRLAWDTWAQAGTVPGMLGTLARAGFPHAGNMYLIEETGSDHRLVAGNVVTASLALQYTTGRYGWDFDSRMLNTRFALLFDTDHVSLDPSTGVSVQGLLALVDQWRPADSTFWGIYVVLAGKLWGWPPTTTWGQASLNWGGNSRRLIYPDGSFAVTGP